MRRCMAARSGGDHRQRPPPLTFPPSFPHSTPFPHWIFQNEIIKDAFREAKANGLNVTVIKKGEMKLNIDQTLEEVEEEIVEIGSKIYHDKIMSERGVDIRTLLKGVISADKATRRSKGMLMKTGKS